MSMFARSLRFGAVSACAVFLVACSTAPKDDPQPVPQPQTGGVIVPGSVEDFMQVGDRVLFDFDSADLDGSDRATLDAQAAWLQQYSSVSITIEGHADERGTREYNLALGERRANAVRRYLINAGVPASRLSTISYGKERGTCFESTESCWAQNRRGVSVITGGASS